MTMKESNNYEDNMIGLNAVLDLMLDALQNSKPLSLSRFGHGELACIGWSDFPQWKAGFEPYRRYSGATAPVAAMENDLIEALRATDIAGLHASWGWALEDRETAKMTHILLDKLGIKPTWVCSAFITHEMIGNSRFWEILKNRKVILVGRRAESAAAAFAARGVDIVYTTDLEGYGEIERVADELSHRKDWDVALLSAGVPATILAPRVAKQTNKVVIDFGHALDKVMDGHKFNYEKLLGEWKKKTNEEILVSMVMAVYNGEKYLKESIHSALAQTYRNLEIIIVNDGSTDSTREILDAIEDPRVTVIHLEKNQGAAHALNTGIKQAQGSWIAIQDADDNSHPQRIEEQVRYILRHPELIGVGSMVECIPGRYEVPAGWLRGLEKNRNSILTRQKIRQRIYFGSPLTHSAVMFYKKAFWEVGGYNNEYKIAYDHDLWLRLLEKGDIENIPKVLLQYRVHTSSLSHADGPATIAEIEMVSSRAIYRLLTSINKSTPKVIVIGTPKSCWNYYKKVAPVSGLQIENCIYRDWEKQIRKATAEVNRGDVDALIVLYGGGQKKVLQLMKNSNLKLNQQLFYIYALS